MKIVIDAYQAAPHITGTDRFARNTLVELQKIDSANDYFVLVNPEFSFVSDCINAQNFTLVPIVVKKRALWWLLSSSLLLKKLRADVFYSFHNLASPSIHVCKTVGSILDTIPISQPSLYFGSESGLRKTLVLGLMRRSSRVADKFLAISEYTKSTAVKDLRIPPNKIKVVYLQADPMFFQSPSNQELERIRQKYKLPAQFVFTMGASEPRKNVSGLVKAHQQLPNNLRSEFPLIIAGAKWHDQEIDIGNDPNIRLAGFIDDADLPLVYRQATLFAFPSKYEGFGLPILEAMASGTPVLTSNVTSVPEVAGKAAVSVDPDDIKTMSAELHRLLSDSEKRQVLIKSGHDQVKKFSWEQTARQLLELLV